MADRPPTIVLASGSPRRRALLTAMRVPFVVATPDVDEDAAAAGHEVPRAAVVVAAAKAQAVLADPTVAAGGPEGLVLAADTMVSLDGASLGKPADTDDARRMLQALSGRTITVATGVVLRGRWRGRAVRHQDVVITTVSLRTLAAHQVDTYVATGEADDKAGALALQGAAWPFVAALEGSYTNLLGLPVELVGAWLDEVGIVRPPLAETDLMLTRQVVSPR